MELESTRRFFNTEFIIKNKLSFSSVIILQDIYFWIFGKKPPKSLIIGNKKFFYISQTHFATLNVGLLSQPAVHLIFSELKKAGIIGESVLVNRHMNYITFNWSKIKESIMEEDKLPPLEYYDVMGMSEETLVKFLRHMHKYIDEQKALKNIKDNPDDLLNQGYEIVVKNNRQYLVKKKNVKESYNEDMKLLTDEEMGIKAKICPEADRITRLILKRYGMFFSHKVPKEGTEPTKTYVEICNKITDIYNGTFIKSRFYPMGEKFLNNKQFNITGWKDKLKEAQEDWTKVKKLILTALKNFDLMHEENRLPYSKNYLQSNLNLWFYDKSSDYDNPQSQFVLCLFEPEFTNKHNSEAKADRIFEKLPEKVKIGGNRLFSLNENMPAGSFWQKVKEMLDWGKLAFEYEPNITYWITSPTEIVGEFAKYCEEKEISVSVSTLDIKKAVESNSPWTWFIKDVSIKHGLNSHLSELVNKKDFEKCYKDVSRITFDDMSEVVF